MFRMHHTHALASVLSLCLAAAPALADSTSSASSAASTSVGSSSASLGTSSNSSSSKERVAQGPYTVLALTDEPQQPDMVTLHLQAVAPASGTTAFTLTLPRTTAEREQLAAGHTVLAQHRPYGLAFATQPNGQPARPFFLVLDDSWHRELDNRPVGG